MSENRAEYIEEEHHEEHEEGEPWLVSYADMMTLLFGFFVLMYVFATQKIKETPEDVVQVRKEIAQYFGGEYITPLKGASDKFKEEIEGTDIGDGIEISNDPEGMTIKFKSQSLFDSGSARISSAARAALDILAGILEEEKMRFKIISEGHTDDVPLRRGAAYSSNWSLAGARAASVIEVLEVRKLPISEMFSIGYGESKPLRPNRDADGKAIPENQELNRRVVLKIIIDNPDESPAKSGAQNSPSPNGEKQQPANL